MKKPNWTQIAGLYSRILMDDVIPFWLRHAIDREHGGLFTCIRDDGSQINGDKYLWSQCRAIWTFAALFNRIEPREEFLQIASDTARFVLRYGRDEKGNYVFQTARDGKPVQGAISISTDFFAAYGLGELYRATKEKQYLEEALRAFRNAVARTRMPGFNDFAPYVRPEGIGKVHGIPMIGIEVGQELAESAPEDDVLAFVDECLHQIMDHHVRWPRRLLLEHLGPDNEEVNTPAGRAVVPGHAIESMWFVIHQAKRRGDKQLARQAVEVIRWMLEAGWDQEKGGLLLAIDAEGGPAWWKHADKKIWWPHTEALYALLLAYEVTGENWCLDWHEKVLDWSLAHFPDRTHGEWHQKLNRNGQVIDELIALPVKDPFHLPRMLILSQAVFQRFLQKQ